MKKRLLMILIAAVMVMCAIPLTANADAGDVLIGGQAISSSGTYTSSDYSFITSGSVKVEYSSDYASAVMTLTDATIQGDCNLIESYIPIEIVLVGNNTMNVGGQYDNAISLWSEDATNKISGTGSLNITGTGTSVWGFYVYDIIEFIGDININIELPGNGIYLYCYGVGNQVIFNLTSKGRVSTTSTDEDFYPILSYQENSIIYDNNKLVTPVDGKMSDDGKYIVDKDGQKVMTVVITGPEATTPTTAGADTSDSSNLALFVIMGLFALCGAGFVYKRREN